MAKWYCGVKSVWNFGGAIKKNISQDQKSKGDNLPVYQIISGFTAASADFSVVVSRCKDEHI